MTTQTEALKLALEAFTIVRFCVPPAQRPTIERAITTTIEALAQPEQEPVAWIYKSEPSFDGNKWHDTFEVTTSKQVALWKDKAAKPLYTTPPQPKEPEQEPVAWKDLTNSEMMALCRDIESRKHSAYDILCEASKRLKARNTTPPQRTWVGLTEIQQNILLHRFRDDPVKLAMEIERELKEKNT